MHGTGWFAEGVDTFRGAYLARHATPAPKRRGDLRGRGPLAPPLQTVSEIVGYPPKSCNKSGTGAVQGPPEGPPDLI